MAKAMSRIINFLDLDLDAFLKGVPHNAEGKDRPSAERYPPWTEHQVRDFLERQCGLSRGAKIPGRFVVEHDGAYDYWRDLCGDMARLNVTHVDGHADLGMAHDGSWLHLLGEHLHLPVSERIVVERRWGRLNPGNYLCYALAARWINSLVNVYPPGRRPDLPHYLFRDLDPTSGSIQLRAYAKSYLSSLTFGDQIAISASSSDNPEVPFRESPIADFMRCESYEYALLSQSPAYTPQAADALIPVFAEYIEFDTRSDATA